MAALTRVSFRPCRDGDGPAINDGFNRVFGLQRPLAEWEWKFPVEPEGRWIMLAVDAEDRILAHYGAVPLRLKLGALTVRAGQLVDVYSVPEARDGLAAGRAYLGAVKSFIATFCAPDRLGLAYGFPGERALRLGVARLGYDQIPPQPVMHWTRPAAPRGRLFTRHEVRSGFDAASLDELWRRARERHVVSAERDASWLGRRFGGRPGVEYQHLAAWRRGRAHAWGVIRLGGPTAYWAELVWDGEDERALAALDRAVAARAREAGASRIELWLMGDESAAAALSRLSWVAAPHPAGVAMVVRLFHPAIDPAVVPGHFYVTMGDADLV